MVDKFSAMAAKLQKDSKLAARFAEDPRGVLKDLDVSPAVLNKGNGRTNAAGNRAKALLKKAAVKADYDIVGNVTRLSKHAPEFFKDGFDVKFEPLAFSFLERTKETKPELTGTGTIRCTFGPWDGCQGDHDS